MSNDAQRASACKDNKVLGDLGGHTARLPGPGQWIMTSARTNPTSSTPTGGGT